MLPGSSGERIDREAARGKQSGRTVEIQRLIGRSLRQSVDIDNLSNITIQIDCDVIQADGGTRTAAITGSSVAVHDALKSIGKEALFLGFISAVSVGIVNGKHLLDLEYIEDSQADTDLNFVVREGSGIVEIQGTAEREPFGEEDLNSLLTLAKKGTKELYRLQIAAVDEG